MAEPRLQLEQRHRLLCARYCRNPSKVVGGRAR
jgi:hypothetical protein